VTLPTPPLIEALQSPDPYDHHTGEIRMLQTHISWVLLTGPFAYKVKKPVDLGFVDYTTLERREHFCREEIRLNRRLAPDLYRGMVPVTGSPENPRVDGDGEPFEYAVKMVQFDQENLLSRMLERGELTANQAEQLGGIAADFHAGIPAADPGDGYATPEGILRDTLDNFDDPLERMEDGEVRRRLQTLRTWSLRTHEDLEERFEQRLREGFVRECHGDMHLENMLRFRGELTVFDCIEFNDDFRWIDVMNEVAFALMDLESRGRADFAARFLDRYLRDSGDYGGLDLLRYYKSYRAMVRFKVNFLQRETADLSEEQRRRVRDNLERYLALAESYRDAPAPRLVITHGVSGSGKSTAARALLEAMGAVRIRSDVERKRLAGLDPDAGSDSGLADGLYSPDMTERTYERLAGRAGHALGAGLSVIVDATFLDENRRARFRKLAGSRGVPFHILDCRAPEEVLRERVAARGERGVSEAGPDVLEHQLEERDPLTEREREHAVPVDGTRPPDGAALLEALKTPHE